MLGRRLVWRSEEIYTRILDGRWGNSFSAKDDIIGQILMGETNGRGVQAMLIYLSNMANSFLPAAHTILNNLQFKAVKLPLEPSQG
jgi:hypothetical protein